MARPAKIHLNLAALQHNLQIVQQCAPKSKIVAVIKANAYGHGLNLIATALANKTDIFGVACIDEALLIRNAGINTPILLLEGFFSAEELPVLAQQKFATVIHSFHQLELLEKTPLPVPLTVWLKIDTGMHRLGFKPKAFPEAWTRLQRCPWVNQPPKLMSHFAIADEPTHPLTIAQLTEFQQLTQSYSTDRSLANSAGILAWPESHFEWVRPGILLYGVSPFANHTGTMHQLKTVMTLKSELIAIRHCKAGESIGYGATWTCPEDTLIGTIAIGYADGYPRHAKSGTPVLVNKQIVPLVGRVSMDMITVNLQHYPQAKIGDEVVLWGDGLPIEQVAAMADTIPYQLLCNVTDRVR